MKEVQIGFRYGYEFKDTAVALSLPSAGFLACEISAGVPTLVRWRSDCAAQARSR